VGAAVANGAGQAVADADRVFFADHARQAARLVLEERRGQGRVLAVGQWHTLFASEPGPFPEDEFWNTFHLGPRAMSYYLGQPLERLARRSVSAWDARADLVPKLRDGDAVLRFDDVYLVTSGIPAGRRPPPLEIWSVARTELTPTLGSEGARASFAPAQALTGWLYVVTRRRPEPVFVSAGPHPAGVPILLGDEAPRDVLGVVLYDVAVRPAW